MSKIDFHSRLQALAVQAIAMQKFAENIIEHVTVLKKELEDSGASKSSARKGVSNEKKAKVLSKIQKRRIKKPPL